MNTSTTQNQAWGMGLATISSEGTILDTWYPKPQLGPAPTGDAVAGTGRVEIAGRLTTAFRDDQYLLRRIVSQGDRPSVDGDGQSPRLDAVRYHLTLHADRQARVGQEA